MKPVETDTTNTVFKLQGGTEENDLPILSTDGGDHGPTLTSFWRLDGHERRIIAEGGRVVLTVFGRAHPPVLISIVGAEDIETPDPESVDLVIDRGRAWPLIANARYDFSGEELVRLLTEAAGATSGVFLQQDPEKVMPGEDVLLAVQAWAIETTPAWAAAHDRGRGLLGAGSATFGEAGIRSLRRLIDNEGSPAEYDQMKAVLDAAIAQAEL